MNACRRHHVFILERARQIMPRSFLLYVSVVADRSRHDGCASEACFGRQRLPAGIAKEALIPGNLHVRQAYFTRARRFLRHAPLRWQRSAGTGRPFSLFHHRRDAFDFGDGDFDEGSECQTDGRCCVVCGDAFGLRQWWLQPGNIGGQRRRWCSCRRRRFKRRELGRKWRRKQFRQRRSGRG